MDAGRRPRVMGVALTARDLTSPSHPLDDALRHLLGIAEHIIVLSR